MANRPAEILDQDLAGDYGGTAPLPEESHLKTNALSAAISNLDRTMRSIPSQIARATVGAVKATGQLAGEAAGKVYNKKSTAGMVGAGLGGPIGSAIAQGLADSEVIKTIRNAIQDQVKAVGQKTYQSLKNSSKGSKNNLALSDQGEVPQYTQSQGIKFTRSAISPAAMYKASKDQTAAIDRMRVSTVAAIRQTKTMSEADVRKQNIPKAAKGGFVKQTGKAIVHTGEVIVPKTTVEKQLKTLNAILDVQNQILSETSNLKYSLADDEAGGGGFFKSMFNFGKVFIPIMGGGMYKSDIARSSNPFVTMSSALLQQYRWQRLYGELTKRQLNELIKIQGGEQQDVIGKRGVFFEFLEKRQKKIVDALSRQIEEREKAGKGTTLKKLTRWVVGAASVDMEKFDLQLRYSAVKKAGEAVDEAIQQHKSMIAAIFRSSFGFGSIKEIGREKEEETPHELMKKMFMREHVESETGGYRETEEIGRTPAERFALETERLGTAKKSKGSGTITYFLSSINENVSAIRKKFVREPLTEGGGPEAHYGDWKSIGSKIKSIVMKSGQRITLAKDDIVEAYKKNAAEFDEGSGLSRDIRAESENNPIVKWLKVLAEDFKQNLADNKKSQIIMKSEFDETQKQTATIERIHEEEKKAAEKEAKRRSVWERIKGITAKAKESVDIIKSVFETILSSKILLGLIAALIATLSIPGGGTVAGKVITTVGKAAWNNPWTAAAVTALLATKTGRAFLSYAIRRGWTTAKITPQLLKVVAEEGTAASKAGKIVGEASTAYKVADEARKIKQLEKMGINTAEATRLVRGGQAGVEAATAAKAGTMSADAAARAAKFEAGTAALGTETAAAGSKASVAYKAGKGYAVAKAGAKAGLGPMLDALLISLGIGKAIEMSSDPKLQKTNEKNYEEFIKKLKEHKATVGDYFSAAMDPAGSLSAMEDERYRERAEKKAKKEKWVKNQEMIEEHYHLKEKMKKDKRITSVKDERLLEGLYKLEPDEQVRTRMFQMLDKGASLKDVQKWHHEYKEKAKKYQEEKARTPQWERDVQMARKFEKICQRWGKDNVLPIMKITNDPDLTNKILMTPNVTNKDAQKYADLITSHPDQKDELVAYMRTGIGPDQAAELLQIKAEEEGNLEENFLKESPRQLQERKKEAEEKLSKLQTWKDALSKMTSKKNAMQEFEENENIPRKMKDLQSEIEDINQQLSGNQPVTDVSKMAEEENTSGETLISENAPVQAVNDWKGKAKGIISNTGQLLITHPQDVVRAEKQNVSNIGSDIQKRITTAPGRITEQATKAVQSAPGSILSSLTNNLSNMDIGDLANIASGKLKMKDVTKRLERSATSSIRSQIRRIENEPERIKRNIEQDINRAKQIPKHITREIQNTPKNLQRAVQRDVQRTKNKVLNTRLGDIASSAKKNIVTPTTIDTNKAELAKQNATQEQINQATMDVRTAKKNREEMNQMAKSNNDHLTNIMNSVTNITSNSSSTSGGGNQKQESSFYRDIDKIFIGHPYV